MDSPDRARFLGLGMSMTQSREESNAATGSPGSGGAKRTYGADRTYRATESVNNSACGSGAGSRHVELQDDADDGLAIAEAASYADLRKRYEVESTEVGSGPGEGNLMLVC